MDMWLDVVLVLLVLTNLRLLGSSRLAACIGTVAAQAVLLGILPLLAREAWTWRVVFLSAVSTSLKAGVLPWLLRRAAREVGLRNEVEPIVGFTVSLLAGIPLLLVAMHVAARLPLPGAGGSFFLAPVALFTILVGLFVIVTRVKAVMQVLGYLAMENGVYAFGMAFAIQEPLLVEMGILLDVFVAVFVMGIAIHHISREFDHMDTDRLSALKD
ncbi:MAG: NADH-quinone oxidoreductase subunit K [Pirellulales bacterium]